MFEKQEKPGGMLTMGIPGFRLEKNVVEAEIEVLRQLGVHFRTGVEVGKDVTIQQLRQQGFQAFYLAIGAQGGRKLNIPGEDAEGVVAGVDFLRSINLGSIPAMTGKTVVIGGGCPDGCCQCGYVLPGGPLGNARPARGDPGGRGRARCHP